ncbi:MAG TPA: M28 family peptidase [Bryobacteraceae bacterium]|nr:M28 family peptidase [Bryobacteraceae bacterium]
MRSAKFLLAALIVMAAVLLLRTEPKLVRAQTAAPAATTRTRGGRGAQGLPDGRDKLFISDSDYLQFPLPPGEERYASILGASLKKITADIVAISEKSRADGNRYYGRITGTPYDKMTSDYVLAAFRKLGLEQAREQEFSLSPQWFPTAWTVELSSAGRTIPLASAFPFQNGRGTTDGPIEAEAVWVGLGTAADFKGRDVKGKAVFIYSFPTPGGRDHTALTNGMVQRATDAGAALVFVVLGFPGNAQAIASVAPPPIPAMTVGVNDGNAVREAIERGESPKIRLSLDVKTVPGLKTYNTWGVLAGSTDENILIMAHHDGFFDAALDNASGTALMLEIARYYAAIPKAQRRRTLTFLDTSGHHVSPDLGATWVRENARDMLAKTALIANCEHTSQTQIYFLDNGLMTGNTMSARRWYAGGSDAFRSLVKNAFREFGVPLYTVPESSPGGELSQLGNTAPSFHIIDHVFYHTDLDTLDWTPASGMEAVARAYMKIMDGVNTMSIDEVRGPTFKPRFDLGRRAEQ